MARDYRTLKLEILAETKQFVDDMKKSEKQVEGFGGKMEKFGKMAAAAFAAAAAAAVAYAGKLAVDGVKAALADEAAQARLAKALQNVTGATNAQIASVEKQINKMSLAFGIADDELRPSFQRLATATGDLTKAQDGLQLALDISAATGKSVEAVSNALGKAYEGNTGALTRLGIGLSAAEIKSQGLEGTMRQLAQTFGGSATNQANTLEGQINRLRVRFDEAKESVGMALLPAVRSFIDYITNRLIPILIEAKDRAIDPIKRAFDDNRESLRALWAFTKDYLVPLFEFTLIRAIEGVGKAVATITNIIGRVVSEIQNLVQNAVNAINFLITQYNRLPFANINTISLGGGGAVGNFQMSTGTSLGGGGTSASTLGGLVGALGGLSSTISGISKGVTGGSGKSGGGTKAQLNALSQIESDFAQLQALVAQLTGAETSSLSGTYGAFQPMDANRVSYGGGAPIVTVNVNAPSVIDETGFTRAVVDAMNSVERRQAGGLSALFR
jgi:hypothetical protein